MKIISVDKLYDYNYSVDVINAMKQNWRNRCSFSCIGHPKEKNMLLYLCGCKAEYTLPDKSKFYAQSGDIVYTPVNYEYSVRFFDFEEGHYTIGVNLFLYDQENAPFILSDEIIIFSPKSSSCSALFVKVDKYSEATIKRPSKMKAAMYDILSILSERMRSGNLHKEKFGVISEGIDYLEHNEQQKLSIAEIAALCNVSEIYFRRLFKEYAGMSPIKFRIKGKIEKAKLYLEYENMSVCEISDHLGFINPAYFTQQFKSIVGVTPTEYKQTIRKTIE